MENIIKNRVSYVLMYFLSRDERLILGLPRNWVLAAYIGSGSFVVTSSCLFSVGRILCLPVYFWQGSGNLCMVVSSIFWKWLKIQLAVRFSGDANSVGIIPERRSGRSRSPGARKHHSPVREGSEERAKIEQWNRERDQAELAKHTITGEHGMDYEGQKHNGDHYHHQLLQEDSGYY